MAELFLNPWSVLAGAALVAVPVIIHLINRMRFKRVRWAAMEFLLKAQKRMKRKLIFQQLLLLFLRMLMVALFGLLVGRFVGCDLQGGRETRPTQHVVILDDSPSMADGWRGDDGAMTDAFAQAKAMLADRIAPAASQATTPQSLTLVRLSDPETPREFGRLNGESVRELGNFVKDMKPGLVRGSLPAAVAKAKAALTAGGNDVAPVVHLLGDFRAADWAEDGPAMKAAVEELTAAKAKVYLIDVCHPYRTDDKRPPLFHDNVSITELRPLKAVVPRFESADVLIRVRNYGGVDLKDVRFAVSINGDDNKGQSVSFPALPAGGEKSLVFRVIFDRVGTDEKPLERFSTISARLETPEPGGLAADNVRHAVVEVKEKLGILAVEGRPQLRDKKDGDGFYLQRLFAGPFNGFDWKYGTAADLERLDAKQYNIVFLLNVPAVSDAAAKKLDEFARGGGGVGIFLGPDVRPKDYNDRLYAGGAGVMPVPLPEKPSEALTEEQKITRLFSLQKKLLLRDKAARRHPALAGLYFDERGEPSKDVEDTEKFFNFVVVNQYWPVKRLGKWRDDPQTTELFCLPNEQNMGDVEAAVRGVLDRVPIEEPKYAKYREAVLPLKQEIRRTSAGTEPLYRLGTLLDRLLSDQQSQGDPAEALVREFWSQPELQDVKAEVSRLRDAVKFGDPLFVAKAVGRGRVVACLTTAGEQWNDWAGGPARASYVAVLSEFEKYLSGGGAEESRSVGEPWVIAVPAEQYRPTANLAFVATDPAKAKAGAAGETVTDLKSFPLLPDGTSLRLSFPKTAEPGVYAATLTRIKGAAAGADAAEVPEYRAEAFNVDAGREGDLRRATGGDVLQYAPGALLVSPGQLDWLDKLKNKQTDLSETGWVFLALLLILIAEHALAVKLSFHNAAGAPEPAAVLSAPAKPAEDWAAAARETAAA